MRVGIIGGSGYVGGELLRLLLHHPQTEVALVTSEKHAGEYVHAVHPNLRGLTHLKFTQYHLSKVEKNCDLVFTALPHGASVKIVPELLKAGLKVIDMSADFRLKNPESYLKWYGWNHPVPELLMEAVYGLPELHREEIREAKLVACPGCMATATILPLMPLIKSSLIDLDRIIVDVKVGSSGAGAAPSAASHHPERSGGTRPYKPTDHRHIPEIEQELSLVAKKPVRVAFTPHAVNMVRGILATVHAFLAREITMKDVWMAYRLTYENEAFIRFLRYKKGLYQYPDPKIVVGSNFCDIGFEVDSRVNRLVVFSAIDNLMKGAAGQAVHCLNIMLGINEKTGLEHPGFHPV
ncbi:MAG: N-acetyl-gamma-glutamyl-phosphate reductase [Candidatus Bathyarchaeota archaeon]|nr:N-acetyl-gamma-glutamyl-phosphate reductase [Candidatus Bathyarchaeota archaeon]